MKKRIVKIVLLAVLLLIVGMSLSIMYTNAKYTSTVNGEVLAEVAKYVFNVSASDSYNQADTIANLKLAQTCNANTLVNGKIAPGTSGNFDIIVNVEGADVAIKSEIEFEAENENELPENLDVKLDGNDWDFSKIEDTIAANAGTKTITHTVTWNWPYETQNGDASDTTAGQNGFNYEYNITATGTQVEPV